MKKTLLLLSCLISAGALAADESYSAAETSFAKRDAGKTKTEFMKTDPHIGLLGGISEVPGGNAAAIGLDVGFEPLATAPVSFGASVEFGGPNEDSSRTFVMAKSAYNFGGDLPVIRYSYAGLNAGWGHDSVKIIGDLSATDNYFAFGPTLGFDQPIAAHWTFGAEAKYLFNIASDADNTFTALGAAKYWF